MSKKAPNQEEIKNNFLESLLNIDRDQLTEFINNKGKDPKMIKPFICLSVPGKEKEK